MNDTINRRWATRAEAAEYARCSTVTIDRYLTAGTLQRYGHQYKVLIDLDELDEILLSNTAPRTLPWDRA